MPERQCCDELLRDATLVKAPWRASRANTNNDPRPRYQVRAQACAQVATTTRRASSPCFSPPMASVESPGAAPLLELYGQRLARTRLPLGKKDGNDRRPDRSPSHLSNLEVREEKMQCTLLDLCVWGWVTSLRKGHDHLLCLVPHLLDVLRRVSKEGGGEKGDQKRESRTFLGSEWGGRRSSLSMAAACTSESGTVVTTSSTMLGRSKTTRRICGRRAEPTGPAQCGPKGR